MTAGPHASHTHAQPRVSALKNNKIYIYNNNKATSCLVVGVRVRVCLYPGRFVELEPPPASSFLEGI